jgi:putative Mg2+ transporter-C (MgtC) family protein
MSSALLVGMAVGLERQLHQRVAGTRTNALVAAGAAAFTMAGAALTTNTDSQSRIAAQIVSGIGFLGAGVIFKEGVTVHGLNTAATIWCSAAIGTLFGLGQYFLGLLTGAMVLITNIVLRPLSYRLHPLMPPTKEQGVTYSLIVECDVESQIRIRESLLQQFDGTSLTVFGVEARTDEAPSRAKLIMTVRGVGRQDTLVEKTLTGVSSQPGITSASWTLSVQSLE